MTQVESGNRSISIAGPPAATPAHGQRPGSSRSGPAWGRSFGPVLGARSTLMEQERVSYDNEGNPIEPMPREDDEAAVHRRPFKSPVLTDADDEAFKNYRRLTKNKPVGAPVPASKKSAAPHVPQGRTKQGEASCRDPAIDLVGRRHVQSIISPSPKAFCDTNACPPGPRPRPPRPESGPRSSPSLSQQRCMDRWLDCVPPPNPTSVWHRSRFHILQWPWPKCSEKHQSGQCQRPWGMIGPHC